MKNKTKVRSLFDREMENPDFRRRFQEEYELFKLEVQLLTALEQSGLTYEQLARAINSHKGNISRDLKGNGIANASLSRIRKLADALGMTFIPLLIAKKNLPRILPQLEKLMAA